MAAEIRITINSTASGSAVADAKKDVADLGKTAKDAGGGFSALKEIGIGALRELGSMGVGFAMDAIKGLFGAVQDGIQDAREAAKVNAQTAQVIKSTGNAAGTSAQHVQDYAASLSAAAGKSLFGDSQIQESTNMLLTFTNIKGTVLDAATAISVDMAQALGGAPRDNAIQLGKALNDPIKGVTALTRVGVTFSQDQKDMIQAMVETGDVAGAQQVILAELNKEFGGSAEAAAKADGGWAQFNDRLGEAKETIGAAILPLLSILVGFLNDQIMPAVEAAAAAFSAWLGNPDTQSGIQTLTTTIQTGLGAVLDFLANTILPMVLTGWEALTTFWTTTLLPTIQTVGAYFQTTILPILTDLATAVMPLVGAAIQVLSGYWTDVLQPALRTAWNIFTTLIVPILADVAKWLAQNLPPAIQAVADFLTGTLFPALHAVYDFINVNVVPVLATVVQWLQTNIPPAVQVVADFWNTILLPALTAVYDFITNSVIPTFTTLATGTFSTVNSATQSVSDLWNNTLKPALNAVWSFLNTYVIPLFTALANVTIALVKLEVRALAALWTDVLKPAFNAVWAFVTTYLTPTLTWLNDQVLKPAKEAINSVAFAILGAAVPQLQALANTVKTSTGPALDTLSGIADDVKGAINSIGDAVKGVIKWLSDLASKIDGIDIPDWLQGHSPPPLANWLTDIGQAAKFATVQMTPAIGLAGTPTAGFSPSSASTTNNQRTLNYSPVINNYGAPSDAMDWATANSLAGV